MPIRIYLTGRVAMEVDGKLVFDERQFRGRQGRIVFAYLVYHRTRTIPKEELARLLWPAGEPPAWEESVSALVSRLRGLLSTDGLTPQGARISQSFGQYQLSLPGATWVDLEAAAAAIDRAEGALRVGDYKTAFGPATVAAGISGRPFLSGDNGEWVESQRRKLGRQRRRALECLAQVWLLNGEPDLAVETATEALALDPLQESGYQVLMRAYLASGNRPKAVRAYHDLRQRLAEELGINPSVETEAMFLELLG